MRNLVLFVIGMLICLPTAWAHHRAHHHKSIRIPHTEHAVQHVVVHPEDGLACAASMLYHEARGVDSEPARIELSRVVFSRVGRPGFAPTICGVVHQKTYVKKWHKTVCQFTWNCKYQHIRDWDPVVYKNVEASVNKAWKIQQARGPLRALFFSSSGKCPIRPVSFYHKGPFVFCVAKKTRLAKS